MYRRHRLERLEKKSYTEPDVRDLDIGDILVHVVWFLQISDEMKATNRTFSILHGISSLTNLIGILAITFHGMWIAQFGIQGY
jgi:hypothetical protein